MEIKIGDILFPKQQEFYKAYKTGKYDVMMFGGGMGGGKSWLLAVLFLSKAYLYGGTVYGVFRKNLTTLKRTTYQTFKRVAEELHIPYEENRADMFWKITGRNGKTSIIWFSELDESKDTDFNKVKSFELTDIGVDEANEISEEGFNILTLRKGRVNPFNMHCFIYLSCNPDKNWVKSRIYDRWRDKSLPENYYFLPSLATDNTYLTEEYLRSFQDLPEAEKQRYLYGNWDFADDPNQLIKYEWIKGNIWTPEGEPDTLGVDVAREGDDRTVFAYSSKGGLHDLEVFKHQDTMTTAQLALERMKEKRIGFRNTGVDVVGVGGGVVDAMREQGYYITDFNSGKSPTKMMGHLLFKNLRAESYWDLREALQKGEYKLPDNKDLIQELLSIHYKVNDKVIQIESKTEMKKRMGHSPDLADAVVISKYCSKGKPEILVGTF